MDIFQNVGNLILASWELLFCVFEKIKNKTKTKTKETWGYILNYRKRDEYILNGFRFIGRILSS